MGLERGDFDLRRNAGQITAPIFFPRSLILRHKMGLKQISGRFSTPIQSNLFTYLPLPAVARTGRIGIRATHHEIQITGKPAGG
jgi:hypothetical protein